MRSIHQVSADFAESICEPLNELKGLFMNF